MAWVYDKYAKDASLYRLQDNARLNRQSLWGVLSLCHYGYGGRKNREKNHPNSWAAFYLQYGNIQDDTINAF
jgi:hypothetical protein